MDSDPRQLDRSAPVRALLQPHVVAYLVVVLIAAGVLLSPDAALLMAVGTVIAASGLALAGAFRLTTRWRRFSLRTGLIVITVFCLALGWVVDEVRDRAAAVATIERLGGSLQYGRQPRTANLSLSEQWLWRVLGQKYMAPVEDVSLVRSNVTDADLAYVGHITSIERLDLDYSPVGDAGIENLVPLRNLMWLDVEDTRISDNALASIAKLPSLDSLILDQNKITDEGLRSLRAAPKLRYLRLRSTSITDAGLEHLAGLKTLTSLDLSGTRVTPEGVAKFQQKRPRCRVAQ